MGEFAEFPASAKSQTHGFHNIRLGLRNCSLDENLLEFSDRKG